VKHKIDPDTDHPGNAGFFKRYFVELPRLLKLALKMIYRFARIEKSVAEFNRNFDHHYNRWYALDFDSLPPSELMRIYHDMEKNILRKWKTPIVNDFYVMMFYGALKGCSKKWCGDESGSLQNNLICGEGNIESTAPTRMLMRLATEIKKQPNLGKIFLESPTEKIQEIIQQHENAAFIRETIDSYLEKYGFRCINELKLEEPSLHETPEFIYQMIANYVRMDPKLLDVSAIDQREQKIRSDAEKEAFAKLSPLKKHAFKKILRHARAGVKNRENMRFARTKIYGLLRRLLNAMGKHLAEEKIIDAPQDIYYLTVDEAWDYVKGTAVTTNLRGLIALRKEEFDAYRGDENVPDDHFETYGMAYNRNKFKNHAPAIDGENEEGTLSGIGCSPGNVTGIVKIIHSPKDDVSLNGEILVAARTDPGWIPLYPSVSGILIERGSILSHSAIVAREMGIPTIVGIPNLLKSVSNGQKIQMDASTGHVRLQP
jgi:pyruvate,water dikinase